MKREIIIVTDGDTVAKKAVEKAAENIGGRCISLSSGNPTWLSGKEIIELIKLAPHDPVVVMVDDRGKRGEGKGERALKEILLNDEVRVLGVVAVASNGKDACDFKVNFSIDSQGKRVNYAVDKAGSPLDIIQINGDTLSILKEYEHNIPIIVGIGDPGKMEENDSIKIGAPITTAALKEIINHSKMN